MRPYVVIVMPGKPTTMHTARLCTFSQYILCILLYIALSAGCTQGPDGNDQQATPPGSFALEGITIEQFQEKLKLGEYTSEQVVKLYLERIVQIDKSGPGLHSVLETNPDALSIARAMDAERASGHIRGPLHGIPVMLKDNIDTGDKMLTTAGSLALSNHYAKADAFIVKLLRDAGAVILGTTNLTEWSNFRSPKSISGWSSRGGQTKNPYVLDSNPCGSSSGSAVAVAADLCTIAVGTSTDGSIACPASMNGVVGITPTMGLISRTGIIPISKSLDTPGTFGRTVKDATTLLNALITADKNDPVTLANKAKHQDDYIKYLDAKALKGKRIGVEQAMLDSTDPIGEILRNALEDMKKLGAVIIPISYAKLYSDILASEYIVMKYEFKDGINQYLSTSSSDFKTLEDIIRFNNEHAATIMPYFGQELLIEAQATSGLQAEEYKAAHRNLEELGSQLMEVMDIHHLDAICGAGSSTYGSAAAAGWPSITLPMGTVNDLPVGITILSPPYSEPKLISIAYAYEQISQKRTKPKFLATNKNNL